MKNTIKLSGNAAIVAKDFNIIGKENSYDLIGITPNADRFTDYDLSESDLNELLNEYWENYYDESDNRRVKNLNAMEKEAICNQIAKEVFGSKWSDMIEYVSREDERTADGMTVDEARNFWRDTFKRIQEGEE
jgi:hypothetical protein